MASAVLLNAGNTVVYETTATTAPIVITTDQWTGYGELKRICTCESGLKQYNADGTVLTGRINPADKGICQINALYHENTATALNMDIYTEAGNIAYAKWLYDQQGSRPWLWSQSCWNTPTGGS